MSEGLVLDVTHRVGVLDVQAHFQLDAQRAALFGPSGAGKTTLLRIVAGLVRPQAGRLSLHGRVLLDTDRRVSVPPDARGIGFVTQAPALFLHLSVEENLRFGLRSLSRAQQASRVAELVDLLGLKPLLSRRPARLSGGERQRVALARALAPGPKLLLMDEPFSALDGPARRELWAALDAYLSERGVRTLLVSHDTAEVWTWAERVVRMRDGIATEQGTPAEMLAAEREQVLRQLGVRE